MTKENYFYSPGMGEVPEIAVPNFLPDLLGNACDGVGTKKATKISLFS